MQTLMIFWITTELVSTLIQRASSLQNIHWKTKYLTPGRVVLPWMWSPESLAHFTRRICLSPHWRFTNVPSSLVYIELSSTAISVTVSTATGCCKVRRGATGVKCNKTSAFSVTATVMQELNRLTYLALLWMYINVWRYETVCMLIP